MSGIGEVLTSASAGWRFAPQARVQDLVRRAAAADAASLPAVVRELAALPRDMRESVLGSLAESTAAALRSGLTAGSRLRSSTADTLERASSSLFAEARPASRPESDPSPVDELAGRARELVDLAEGASRSSVADGDLAGGRRLVDLASAVKLVVERVVSGLARGASPARMGLLAGELPRLSGLLEQAISALRRPPTSPEPEGNGAPQAALQAAFDSANRLARSLDPAPGAPETEQAPGPAAQAFSEPTDRSLKEDLAGFLGRESLDASGGGTRTWEDPDGTRHGTYEAGSSMYEETGKTFGDPSFSVDADYLKPSGEAPGMAGQVLGGALDALGTVHKEGSFHHEASVIHEQGSFSVGNENAYLAASGEVSVLAASVAGSGSIDVSGGRLTAVGHVEASATLVEASGEVHAKLGPATLDASGYAYVGAKANADGALYLDPAHGVYAAKVQAKAFAGATAEVTARGSLGDVATGEVGVGAWAGVGARFELDAGFKDGEFKFKIDLGAALGVGFNVNLGFSINVKKVGQKLASAFDTVDSFVKALPLKLFGGGGGGDGGAALLGTALAGAVRAAGVGGAGSAGVPPTVDDPTGGVQDAVERAFRKATHG